MGWKRRLYFGLKLDKLGNFGISIPELVVSLNRLPGYYRDIRKYREKSGDSAIPISNYTPMLTHIDQGAGTASGHYFHQDLWAAKRIRKENPEEHYDIGSKIDGFVSHLLVFRDVTVIDIRSLDSNVQGLEFIQDDATKLDQFEDNSVESISSLHAAEHFGLGRYGDPIDPEGHTKFMDSIQRVLQKNGKLYFSVPVGQERVEFNAHRVLSPYTVLDQFEELELERLDGVIDGEFVKSPSPEELEKQEYACGLFEFTK
ncbi:DUF268 domain-containing protein [Halosimplex carlsbadense]|nr:DUF268 domain-containing protein [Halosimplex carlsbadense]